MPGPTAATCASERTQRPPSCANELADTWGLKELQLRTVVRVCVQVALEHVVAAWATSRVTVSPGLPGESGGGRQGGDRQFPIHPVT